MAGFLQKLYWQSHLILKCPRHILKNIFQHNFWIGIYGESFTYDGSTVLKYKWTGGEPIQYTNWEKGLVDRFLIIIFKNIYTTSRRDTIYL